MAKRTRITRPYPTHSIQDSLPVAETIQRVNGGRPVETELLAEALGTSAKSSTFIQKLNASSKYGLTLGSYSDDFIQLTELGESVTAPGSAEEREDSIVEAVTYPDVFREFYRIYSGKRLPEDIYASNTLVRELGVPRELTEECLGIIRRNGLVAGIVSDQGGVLIVGAVAESEEAGHYTAEPSMGRGTARIVNAGTREGDELDTGAGADILIVSVAGDPVHSDVSALVEGLSLPSKSVVLDASGDRIISQEISSELNSARGCIFVWPENSEVEAARAPSPILWATFGALSYQLGRKLIVLIRESEYTSLDSLMGDSATTFIQAANDESVYPKLIAALVQSGIVKITVG